MFHHIGYYFLFLLILMFETRCEGRKWNGLTDNVLCWGNSMNVIRFATRVIFIFFSNCYQAPITTLCLQRKMASKSEVRHRKRGGISRGKKYTTNIIYIVIISILCIIEFVITIYDLFQRNEYKYKCLYLNDAINVLKSIWWYLNFKYFRVYNTVV